MFLNAVILVLQEILEAALLVSVLLALGGIPGALTREAALPRRWLIPALAAGLAGAWIYAAFTPEIAQWFDDVGLEVTNALIQAGIIAGVLLFCTLAPRERRRPVRVAVSCMILLVSLSIIREVSEIILYLEGVAGQAGSLTPVLLGAIIAVGIGLSGGILLYYGLAVLPGAWAFRAGMGLLALFAGNMTAQAILLLTQADWLPFTPQLWDSSGILAEYSVPGQLLYALAGYEANPSLLQAAGYLAAAALVAFSPLFRRAWTESAAKEAASGVP